MGSSRHAPPQFAEELQMDELVLAGAVGYIVVSLGAMLFKIDDKTELVPNYVWASFLAGNLLVIVLKVLFTEDDITIQVGVMIGTLIAMIHEKRSERVFQAVYVPEYHNGVTVIEAGDEQAQADPNSD